MAHAQIPDFVFRRNGRVHLNRRGASVHSTTGSRVVRISGSNAGYITFGGSARVPTTHSIRQFPLHFPSRASPCTIRFQTHSTYQRRHISPSFSVRPSVRVYQRGSHWRDFRVIDLGEFYEYLMIDQIWIKSANNISHFTWTPRMYTSIVDNNTKYFVARQQGKGTHSCASITTFNGLVLLKASCVSTVIQRECIVCLQCCYCYTNPPRKYVIEHPV